MTEQKIHPLLQKLLGKWKRIQWTEALFWSLGAGVWVGLLVFVSSKDIFWFPIIFAGGITLSSIIIYNNLLNFKIENLLSHLNRRFPVLEQSNRLLTIERDKLNSLQQIQQEKIITILKNNYNKIYFKNNISKAMLFLLAGLGIVGWFVFLPTTTSGINEYLSNKTKVLTKKEDAITKEIKEPVKLITQNLAITPPAYTGLSFFNTKKLNTEAPYGSKVKWQLKFSGALEWVKLQAKNQMIPLTKKGDAEWSLEKVITEEFNYQILFKEKNRSENRTGYYTIKIIPDQKPAIKIEGLPSYKEFEYDSTLNVSFVTHLEDDYGIRDAYLMAMISRGEGENVKFREEKIKYNQSFGGKKYSINKNLFLKELKMGPGDELYLHVEAKDNRYPNPQTSKTNKYIISFKDTTKAAILSDFSMPIDKMPAYFRSQRQIIIDTKKILTERGEIAEDEFKKRCNDIGVDQKILRLRYGKFLGEEFEESIGGHDHEAEEKAQAEPEKDSLTQEEVHHDHDHEADDHHHDHDHDHHDHEHHDHEGHEHEEEHHDHEHGEEEAHSGHDHHHHHSAHSTHDHEEKAPDETDESQQMLEEFMHLHDRSDHASFFDRSTSAKLRRALAFMWDAELHLRLAQPEKALPFEQKALKLIKEIQQASRVYVERVGFESPVIKEAEQRLKGEGWEEIQPRTRWLEINKKTNFNHIKNAVSILQGQIQYGESMKENERITLQRAGEEVAKMSLTHPLASYKLLSGIRQLKDGEKMNINELKFMQRSLIRLLPYDETQLAKKQKHRNQLNDLYLKQLNH